jgi:hypothetical protein
MRLAVSFRNHNQANRDMLGIKTEWIAVYAAIVSTGALLLAIKCWFEAGPRLRIAVIPEGMTVGGGPEVDEAGLILVTVTNRGDAATMITNLLVLEFGNWIQRLRRKAKRSMVVTNPQLQGDVPNVPSILEPGLFWTGAIRLRKDMVDDLHVGRFYVGVSSTHFNRPLIKRIPKRSAKRSLPRPVKMEPVEGGAAGAGPGRAA